MNDQYGAMEYIRQTCCPAGHFSNSGRGGTAETPPALLNTPIKPAPCSPELPE